jgi:hypothetical protein
MDVAHVLSEGIAIIDHGGQAVPREVVAAIRSLGEGTAVLGE